MEDIEIIQNQIEQVSDELQNITSASSGMVVFNVDRWYKPVRDNTYSDARVYVKQVAYDKHGHAVMLNVQYGWGDHDVFVTKDHDQYFFECFECTKESRFKS